MAATQSERALSASVAAHSRWAGCQDRAAATEPARRAALERFEQQVDPDATLPPAERARRAEHARKAYMAGLALKSARSRRLAAARTVEADAADSELAEAGGPDAS